MVNHRQPAALNRLGESRWHALRNKAIKVRARNSRVVASRKVIKVRDHKAVVVSSMEIDQAEPFEQINRADNPRVTNHKGHQGRNNRVGNHALHVRRVKEVSSQGHRALSSRTDRLSHRQMVYRPLMALVRNHGQSVRRGSNHAETGPTGRSAETAPRVKIRSRETKAERHLRQSNSRRTEA